MVANVIKLFSSLVRKRYVRSGPLKGRLLALPVNIKLGLKGLQGANALAYLADEEKSLNVCQTFILVIEKDVAGFLRTLQVNIRLGWKFFIETDTLTISFIIVLYG
jgi:hypothetical protein